MLVFIEKIRKEEETIICHRNKLLLQNHRMVEVGKILGLFHSPTKENSRQCFFASKINQITIQVVMT